MRVRRALVLLTPVSRRPNARRGSEGFAVSGVLARPPAAYSMGRPVFIAIASASGSRRRLRCGVGGYNSCCGGCHVISVLFFL